MPRKKKVSTKDAPTKSVKKKVVAFNSNDDFIKMSVIRRHDGVTIKCQCPMAEEFFANLPSTSKSTTSWGSAYHSSQAINMRTPNGRFGAAGDSWLWDDEVSNMSFLRLVGIKDGIEFKLNGLFSNDNLKSFCCSVTKQFAHFHAAYLVQCEYNVHITKDKTANPIEVIE